MPYRLNGNCVQKQDAAGIWRDVKGGCHSTKERARAHLAALNANVRHGKSVSALKAAMDDLHNIAPSFVMDDGERLDFERTFYNVLNETGDPLKAKLAAYGALKRRRFGLAVKSAQAEVQVMGWGLWFSDTLYRDRQNTHFPPKTNLMLEFYPNAPLWYEHGMNAVYGTDPIGKRVHTEVYDHGVWVVHELFQDHPQYARTIKEIEDGVLALSSDSISHYVQRGYEPVQHSLNVWPLAGWSLTRNEAEPALGGVILNIT